MKDLSFAEKSLWVMLLGLLIAFGFYFSAVSQAPMSDVMAFQVILFGLAVALLVIVQIGGHLVIAVVDRRDETDERDRMIELKGDAQRRLRARHRRLPGAVRGAGDRGNFMMAHVLLGAWLAAQLVQIASQLVMYRRGARGRQRHEGKAGGRIGNRIRDLRLDRGPDEPAGLADRIGATRQTVNAIEGNK